MKRFATLVVLLIVVSMLLPACAAPQPQVVEKIVTQVVEQKVEVEKIVTQVVEKTVVETQVVVATPVPPTAVPQAPTEKQMGGTLNVWLPNGWPDKAWPYLSNWESTFAVSPMAEGLFWPKPDGGAGADACHRASRLAGWSRLHRPSARWRQVA
jgi:hypothetical protein